MLQALKTPPHMIEYDALVPPVTAYSPFTSIIEKKTTKVAAILNLFSIIFEVNASRSKFN